MTHRRHLFILLGLIPLVVLPMAGQINQASGYHEVLKKQHVRVKDDIQAIGNRNIGGRGFGNWYSLEQEIRIGRDYSGMVESNVTLIADPLVTEYINRIAQTLVRNSDAKVPFTIKVVDSEEINAFALPGGFLYVNSGLILAAQEEAELAGVMAHEIAHVAAHHGARQLTDSQFLQMATFPLVFLGGPAGAVLQQAAGFAGSLRFTRFSRGFEAEADYLGVQYLYQSGYDPQAFISFFERVQALEKQKPGLISKMFSRHPQTAGRIHKTQSEIVKILPPRDTYVVTTSEFDKVQSHLATIQKQEKGAEEDANRLTLRQRQTSDDQGGSQAEDKIPELGGNPK